VAIILLTVIIKLALWPLSRKAIKSQLELQEIQPKLEELKKKYADNQVELGTATMNLYKEYHINPFASCLPLLIQIPFLFAVFRVLRKGLLPDLNLVYFFMPQPQNFHMMSLGFMDLGQPIIYLAILAGVAQFVQSKMMLPKKANNKEKTEEKMTDIMNKQMVYMFPVVTVIMGVTLPGGLTLYWFMFTLMTVIQQLIVLKIKKKNQPVGPIEGEIVK
jgi:YidC/Oxa1 family membrane protein insertase